MSCDSNNLNIQSVAGISGVATTAIRYINPYTALLAAQLSVPAALAGMLTDLNNGSPSNVSLNDDGTLVISGSVINLTAKVSQVLLIAGLVVGAPVSGSTALALGVLAIALSPSVQERISDPNFWNDISGNLMDIITPSQCGPDPATATTFAAASIYVPPVRRDPLVLDLDGDGIETLPINTTTPVMFDLDNTGMKKSVGWVKADDGFLVLDRNGNGTIDTGAELFGDATPLSGGGIATDGFAALAQLDTNLDGKITSADSAFTNLRVWRDLNQNGLSEAGELSTLTSLNITSINVAASSHTITVANGNLITDQGSYTRGDGTVGSAGETANSADVHLATDPFHTTFTTPLTLTAQALTLPDMNGSGQVRSLREAISSNSTLATLVTQFTQATTSADRRGLLDNILKEWSNTSTMSTTFTGAYAGHTLTVNVQGVTTGSAAYLAWQDKLTILEHFNGRGGFPSYAANTDWKLVA